jgi:membrane protease YdiL (CAAX protease family)
LSARNGTDEEVAVGGGVQKRVQGVEVAVFLTLIVPSLVLGALVRRPDSTGFIVTAAATIAQDIGLVALVLYFLWRNGEPVRRLGWNLGAGVREVLIGAVLFVPLLFATAALAQWLTELGLSGERSTLRFLQPAGTWQLALGFVLVAVVAVAEETIFRGYLLLRFKPLTRSAGIAVLLSSIIFGIGHGYEGTAGMVSVTVLGIAYALVYEWRRSLVAPIAMHFLQDFVGIVLPSLGR